MVDFSFIKKFLLFEKRKRLNMYAKIFLSLNGTPSTEAMNNFRLQAFVKTRYKRCIWFLKYWSFEILILWSLKSVVGKNWPSALNEKWSGITGELRRSTREWWPISVASPSAPRFYYIFQVGFLICVTLLFCLIFPYRFCFILWFLKLFYIQFAISSIKPCVCVFWRSLHFSKGHRQYMHTHPYTRNTFCAFSLRPFRPRFPNCITVKEDAALRLEEQADS